MIASVRSRSALVVLVVALLAASPLFVSDFFLSAVLTKTLWLGIVAASLIFLSGYGNMISLAQTGLYGVAGFVLGNIVAADGGLKVAWDPWIGVILGLVVATVVGLVFGAVASRSEGIYFLMITLALGILLFYFWGQVTELSGFGGINNIEAPGIVSTPRTDPGNLFYICLVVSLAVYLLIRYIVRTPFGIALQGIRDEPARMRSLGYNVALHRTLAFGLGAFLAAVSGILSVWWNTRIDPGSVGLGRTIDVLVIAIIGGIFWIEGGWLGAFVFTAIDTYSRNIDSLGPRFNTLIGVIFLVIVLVSPGGLIGIWESVRAFAARRVGAGPGPPGAAAERAG